MEDMIKIKNIVKSFDGKKVLEIQNLTIKKGSIVTVLGHNGSGKSTLLKIISGLIYQDEGEIDVLGFSNKNKRIHDIVKFVLESGRGYYDYLSSIQNIKYFLKLNHIDYDKIREELEILFDELDFTQYLNTMVSELSQGNRQKLSLIIAIICKPKVLCMDEPTNGLDIMSKALLEKKLLKLAKENVTILITTHDIDFINNISTSSLILNKGKLLFEGDLRKEAKDIEDYKRILNEAAKNG